MMEKEGREKGRRWRKGEWKEEVRIIDVCNGEWEEGLTKREEKGKARRIGSRERKKDRSSWRKKAENK